MAVGIASAFVGEIRAYAGRVSGAEPITGWLLCDGTSYNTTTRPELQDLFDIIGTTHGGTGATSFNVPNMVGRTLFGSAPSGTFIDSQTPRSTSTTAATHALTMTEIPPHTHTVSVGAADNGFTHLTTTSIEGLAHTHTVPWGPIETLASGFENPRYIQVSAGGGPSGFHLGNVNAFHTHTFTSDASANHTHTISVGTTAAASAHENMPPYAKVLYLIKY